jgi:hypothetical protein
MTTRTARINTVRGILREQGILLPAGARAVLDAAHRRRTPATSAFFLMVLPRYPEGTDPLTVVQGWTKTVEQRLRDGT